MKWLGRLVLLASGPVLLRLAAAYQPPPRFLLISSPATRNIYYAELPSVRELVKPRTERVPIQAHILIDGAASKCSGWGCSEDSDRGLRAPHGLALQQGCGTAVLYVSDTEAQDIFAYDIYVGALGFLTTGPQRRVREGIASSAQWLAVDGLGNLFLSSLDNGQVKVIPAAKLLGGQNRSEAPEVLYSAQETRTVASPAGVATDGFFVYWANQAGDTTSGTVARGPRRHEAAQQLPPEAVAVSNGPYEAMATNVCIARSNAFFTGTTGSLYATPAHKNDSRVTEVAKGFRKPLGCAYDGESTLYVADGDMGAVFSLPVNMENLRQVRHVSKVATVEKPDQLVVFSSASSDQCPPISLPSDSSHAGLGPLAAATAVLAALASSGRARGSGRRLQGAARP